jgi:hypothetical protein
MYDKLEYLNADHTMIRATRKDGSQLVVESVTGDLFEIINSGIFGEIAAYVEPPAPPPRPKSEPMCDIFRLALIAASAFADGVTDPTNDEIKEMLRAAK